jgi:hypothetical protein
VPGTRKGRCCREPFRSLDRPESGPRDTAHLANAGAGPGAYPAFAGPLARARGAADGAARPAGDAAAAGVRAGLVPGIADAGRSALRRGGERVS